MKITQFFIISIFISSTVTGQNKIESFPKLTSFVINEFSNSDNIFPIAFVNIDIDKRSYKIPISYSLLHHTTDSTYFVFKNDNAGNYCFEILDNGLCKPKFKKETLKLPSNYLQFLERTRRNYDSVKSKINLSNYINFLAEPEWWQNDATPKDDEGKPLKFICQLELRDITTDDCSLYIFFDKKKKLVRQIYQRD